MSKKEDLGLLIKTMRLSRNMTQGELAQKIGKTQSSITMYETGRREPDLETLEALADAFNVPMAALVPDSKESVVSTNPWDPDRMGWDETDDSIRIMARGYNRLSEENRLKLLNVARAMFQDDFDEEGNKR